MDEVVLARNPFFSYFVSGRFLLPHGLCLLATRKSMLREIQVLASVQNEGKGKWLALCFTENQGFRALKHRVLFSISS